MTFAERLKEVIGDTPILAFANKCGVPQNSVRQYLGGSVPGIDKAEAIAEAADVSLEWLITGKGNKDGSEGAGAAYVAIPVMATKASAGGGSAMYYDEIGDSFPMSRLWLERHNLKAKDLFVVYGIGESMHPIVVNGEKLLCSSAEHHLRGDGVFIIRQDGDLMVKRLQRLPGKIRVLPANPEYQPYDVELNDAVDFKILGRVLYKNIIQRVE